MKKAPSAPAESARDATHVDQFSAEFASESSTGMARRSRNSGANMRVYVAVIVGALLMTASVAVVGLPEDRGDATLTIDSEPVGKEVRIDSQVRGRTPLTLTLAPGSYLVALEGTKDRRVSLASAERASMYHIVSQPVLDAATAAASTQAGLSVVTEPAGGRVSIDGQDHGTAPLTVRNLTPGEHRLVVRNRGAVFQQAVHLEQGLTSTVVVGGAPTLGAGWIEVRSPLRLQIREAGKLLGATDAERLMLPAGDHQLTFSDDQTGFTVSRATRIVPGDTTAVAIQVPEAPVNVNAVPWAEVWVDNARIGETPIGNYPLMIGSHQIELRHPQLGTKRVIMSVGLNRSNRLAVNMREQ
jgi:hypothetical protein